MRANAEFGSILQTFLPNAAEIIFYGADYEKANMELTTWKNSPDGRILKSDVIVAKNYLAEKKNLRPVLMRFGILQV